MDRRTWLKTVGYLTGSMAFGVATSKSDEDWLVPHDADVGEWLDDLDEPFEYCREDETLFRAYRDGNLNIIRSLNATFTANWKMAHDECVHVQPRMKWKRIAIFRRWLYGEPEPETDPKPKISRRKVCLEEVA